jgi:hypothetical protein
MENSSNTNGNQIRDLPALPRDSVSNSTVMVYTDKNLFQIIALLSFNNKVKVFAKYFS